MLTGIHLRLGKSKNALSSGAINSRSGRRVGKTSARSYAGIYLRYSERWAVDRITESMLREFSAEHGVEALSESARFEHFTSYATVQRLHPETFDTSDIVLGNDEPGIDGIAIIVNGILVHDMDAFVAIAESAATLDVVFIFVQADRSRSFETAKMGNFTFAVRDFFKERPQLPQSQRLKELSELQSAIYGKSAKFKRANPSCYLFYVTSGQWTGDAQLEVRRQSAIAELKAENIFGSVEFECVGAEGLQKLYRQTKNAIERDFTFTSHVVAPEIPGVKEAYLGVLPAKDLLSLVTSEDGEIARGLFESNIRDFQGYNTVNDAIKNTLGSDHKARFVLMNNGITIIARVLRRTAYKFHIEDFQIVNGCQTSNVLFEHREQLDDVMVPLRLIASDDDEVIQSIVTATNQQTQLTREQLFAATEFPKRLEQFFMTYESPHRIYYERRSRQYYRLPIDKMSIVTQANMIRAFVGMFLEDPHRTTRDFNSLLDRIGRDIFVEGHKLEAYYAAAYTLSRIERMFKTEELDKRYKAARSQILLVFRRLANPDDLPNLSSRDMEVYCKRLTEVLWANPVPLLQKAAQIVSDVTPGEWHKDAIRTVSVTNAIKNYDIEKARRLMGLSKTS